MSGYMKLGDVKGESTDQDHKDWIIIASMQSRISRLMMEGARDQQRSRGETRLDDVVVSRYLDKSSPKLYEACANGTYFPEVEIHLCTTVKNRQEPYLSYKLRNVIITACQVADSSPGTDAPQHETLFFGYTEIEWTYVVIDPKTGDKRGQVPGKYNPASGRSQ